MKTIKLIDMTLALLPTLREGALTFKEKLEIARGLERLKVDGIELAPLDGGKAYVCDLQGHFLGVAKVLQAVRADATPEDLAAQLGLRQMVLSAEAKRLAPLARKRQAAAADRAAANLAALGLEDPVSDRDMLPASAGGAESPDATDFL